MIRRSLRLDAIYAWVDGNVVADIGCDHGYIPLWCVQDKGIKAYACDVASKPLERARALFKQEEADIPCLLMDGIEGLPGDVDQIVIAGMGGQLIEHILERSKARAMRLDSMILSPHKDVHLLRSYLRKADGASKRAFRAGGKPLLSDFVREKRKRARRRGIRLLRVSRRGGRDVRGVFGGRTKKMADAGTKSAGGRV